MQKTPEGCLYFFGLPKCPHCGTVRVGSHCHGYTQIHDSLYLSFWSCNQCHKGICVESNQFNQYSQLPLGHGHVLEIYPKPVSTAAPDYTPFQIAEDFSEAKDNFLENKFKSAAIMARNVLEQVMKNIGATGGSLKQKIDFLASEHKITPDMAEWAHSIRLIGNEAVHEDMSVSKVDAEQAVYFTEMLLNYLYTLPGTIKSKRNNMPDCS